MSFTDPLAAAFSVAGNKPQDTIAAEISKRFALVLDPSGTSGGLFPADFVAGDKVSFIWNNKLWTYDPGDTTTPGDDVTCVVTADDPVKRFKSGTVLGQGQLIWPVISFITDPADAGTVTAGDQYGLNDAPTGAFAGFGKYIVTALTPSPDVIWANKAPLDGLVCFDFTRQAFRSYGAAAWRDGLIGGLAAGSVDPEALKVPRFIVEGVLNTPPGAPTNGQYVVVGPAPVGAFVGHANKVAKYNSGWTFFAPAEGWQARNKATSTEFTYTGGAWAASKVAKIVGYPARVVRSATVALSGTAPNQTTAPTSSSGVAIFPEGPSSACDYKCDTGNRLIVKLRLDLTAQLGAMCVALLVDGEPTCQTGNWRTDNVTDTAGKDRSLDYEFEVVPGDTASHTYRIRGVGAGTVQRGYLQFIEIGS